MKLPSNADKSFGNLLILAKSLMNCHDKIFRPISNSANGETSKQTVFHYKQMGITLTAEYTDVQYLNFP